MQAAQSERASRSFRVLAVVVVHVLLWACAFFGAFALRFDLNIPEKTFELQRAGWLLPLVLMRVAAFSHYGLFHNLWKYTGIRDLEGIVKATVLPTIGLVLMLQLGGLRSFPRSVPILEALLAISFAGGLRFSVKTGLLLLDQLGAEVGDRRKLLIVGAGDAGETLVRELLQVHSRRYHVVGFVDDNPRKQGALIHGLAVLGDISQVPSLVKQHGVDELVIAIPSATGRDMRRVIERCSQAEVPIRTVPGLDDLIGGRITFSQLRDVAIEDLLGREPVDLDTAQIAAMVTNASVLVSGAGGSIGSELCRQICRFKPQVLVLVEQAENSLYQIHRELRGAYPQIQIVPRVADVVDRPRLDQIFAEFRPDVVLHAAAHKHVPMMEFNPGEAVKNNIGGTKAMVDAAGDHGVGAFVMISTDKAVNPTSVMGTTKRIAEMYVQSAAGRNKTRYVTVRFGNVLGSAGSVIPLFKEQIARGGPVTVTHKDMMRYFMTIPEASQLVLQAGALGGTGEIYILDMGEPVSVMQLARDLVTLSGLKPDEDIDIICTGIRPGEKLFEELSVNEENAERTRHKKIYVGKHVDPVPHIGTTIAELLDIADNLTPAAVKRRLQGVVPEYTPDLGDAQPKIVKNEAATG